MKILDLIRRLRIKEPHYDPGDCRFSCSILPCDERIPSKDCDCGADEHNKLRQEAADTLSKLKRLGTVCQDLTKDGKCGPIAWHESLAQLPNGTAIYALSDTTTDDENSMPVNLTFGHRIRSDGEITVLHLEQEGNRIQMTRAQAHALAQQIVNGLSKG